MLLMLSSALCSNINRRNTQHLDIHNDKTRSQLKEELQDLQDEKVDVTSDNEGAIWFGIHDTDRNGELDGYELLMALNDVDEGEHEQGIDELEEHVDSILEEGDLDGNGMISKHEFLVGLDN